MRAVEPGGFFLVAAGQTELKLWLEQLARRDDAPTIGKKRIDSGGIVKDKMGTELTAGTSLELDDVVKGAGKAPTQLSGPLKLTWWSGVLYQSLSDWSPLPEAIHWPSGLKAAE